MDAVFYLVEGEYSISFRMLNKYPQNAKPGWKILQGGFAINRRERKNYKLKSTLSPLLGA